MMAIYCNYIRFKNQIEMKGSTLKEPDDTDFVRKVSVTMTIISQIYLV